MLMYETRKRAKQWVVELFRKRWDEFTWNIIIIIITAITTKNILQQLLYNYIKYKFNSLWTQQ